MRGRKKKRMLGEESKILVRYYRITKSRSLSVGSSSSSPPSSLSLLSLPASPSLCSWAETERAGGTRDLLLYIGTGCSGAAELEQVKRNETK